MEIFFKNIALMLILSYNIGYCSECREQMIKRQTLLLTVLMLFVVQAGPLSFSVISDGMVVIKKYTMQQRIAIVERQLYNIRPMHEVSSPEFMK